MNHLSMRHSALTLEAKEAIAAVSDNRAVLQ